MHAQIFSATMKGHLSSLVSITVSTEKGNGLSVSGLITTSLHRDFRRLQLALLNCGFCFHSKKIDIEIDPPIFGQAETIMAGIAVAILLALGKINRPVLPENYCIIGGLGVTGKIHEIDHACPLTAMCLETGFSLVVLPRNNMKFPDFVCAKQLYAARDLISLVNYLNKRQMQY